MKKMAKIISIAAFALLVLVQASIAEVLFKYPVAANEALAVGTVVKLNAATDQIVKATSADRNIIGVVAGYELDGATHYVLVSCSGQLAIKVASAVSAGDRLTISATAGEARTAVNDEDVLIAVALQDAAGAGTITAQIMVNDNQAKYSAFNDATASLGASNVQEAIEALDASVDGLSSGTWNHNSLSGLQGGSSGQYWHLTNTQHTALTTGINADAQHSHNASNILGVTAGTYISSPNVNGALTQLDGAINTLATGGLNDLTAGNGLSGLAYDGSTARTWSVQAYNGISVSGSGVGVNVAPGEGLSATLGSGSQLGIAVDGVEDNHINWGTGANQVSAVDMPIADAGGYYSSTDVEGALQELGTLTGGSVVNSITGGNGITVSASTGAVTVSADLLTNGGLEFSGDKLAVEVGDFAGAGLAGSDRNLYVGTTANDGITVNANDIAVNVDGSTIEISSDALRVKTDGINETHIDWGAGANQVDAGSVPYSNATSGLVATNVQSAIDELDAALDAVAGGAGQGMAVTNYTTATNITSTSYSTIFSSSAYSVDAGSKLLVSFSGTFDDRGTDKNGAYIEVAIYDGVTELATRTIILNDRNFHQSQVVALDYVITSSGSHTINVRAKVVKSPYTSGRFVNGTLTLTEVKG